MCELIPAGCVSTFDIVDSINLIFCCRLDGIRRESWFKILESRCYRKKTLTQAEPNKALRLKVLVWSNPTSDGSICLAAIWLQSGLNDKN